MVAPIDTWNRLLQPENLRLIKEFDLAWKQGKLIPLDEFIDDVISGSLIDYDGFGYWATVTHWGDYIKPSRLAAGKIPPWATHVLWINR